MIQSLCWYNNCVVIQQHFGATIHKFKKQSSPNNKISFTFLLIIEYHKTLCQPINFPCKHYNASLLSIFHFSFFILHKKKQRTQKKIPHISYSQYFLLLYTFWMFSSFSIHRFSSYVCQYCVFICFPVWMHYFLWVIQIKWLGFVIISKRKLSWNNNPRLRTLYVSLNILCVLLLTRAGVIYRYCIDVFILNLFIVFQRRVISLLFLFSSSEKGEFF